MTHTDEDGSLENAMIRSKLQGSDNCYGFSEDCRRCERQLTERLQKWQRLETLRRCSKKRQERTRLTNSTTAIARQRKMLRPTSRRDAKAASACGRGCERQCRGRRHQRERPRRQRAKRSGARQWLRRGAPRARSGEAAAANAESAGDYVESSSRRRRRRAEALRQRLTADARTARQHAERAQSSGRRGSGRLRATA